MPFERIKFHSNDQHDHHLRTWSVSDLDNLLKYANNAHISNNLTNQFPHPYTEESGRQFISVVSELDPARVLCIDQDGEAIGAIGIHPQADIWCKNMEMGYWLAEPFWGQGIITAAVIAVVDHGFRAFDINRIFARPFGNNKGSQRVLEKARFKLEARLEGTIYKNGHYHDELIYAIRREDWAGQKVNEE